MATPTEVLIQVTEIFESLGIPYFVVGSFASSARGIRRATVDADIVADIKPESVAGLVNKLSENDFYIDDLAVRRATMVGRAWYFETAERCSRLRVHVPVVSETWSWRPAGQGAV